MEWGQDQRGFAGGEGGSDWEALRRPHWESWEGEGEGPADGVLQEAERRVCAVRCCSHVARTATATSCLPGSTCTIWEDASV